MSSPRRQEKTLYDVLTVPSTASEAEINSAYKKLSIEFHPDKNLNTEEHPQRQEEAIKYFTEVLQPACVILSDHRQLAHSILKK